MKSYFINFVVPHNFHLGRWSVVDLQRVVGTRVVFLRTTMRVSAKVEDILTWYYGDFMQYPEEAIRVPAHQLRVMCKEHI